MSKLISGSIRLYQNTYTHFKKIIVNKRFENTGWYFSVKIKHEPWIPRNGCFFLVNSIFHSNPDKSIQLKEWRAFLAQGDGYRPFLNFAHRSLHSESNRTRVSLTVKSPKSQDRKGCDNCYENYRLFVKLYPNIWTAYEPNRMIIIIIFIQFRILHSETEEKE